MSFHENFWVVTGTAAPVIALSSILVIRDQFQVAADITEAKVYEGYDDVPIWKMPKKFQYIFFWSLAPLILIIGQAVMLYASLMSIVQGSDYFPTKLAAIAMVLSLGILSTCTLASIFAKVWAKQIIQEGHSMSQRSENARSARRAPQRRKDQD
jgi:hypothetical protein